MASRSGNSNAVVHYSGVVGTHRRRRPVVCYTPDTMLAPGTIDQMPKQEGALTAYKLRAKKLHRRQRPSLLAHLALIFLSLPLCTGCLTYQTPADDQFGQGLVWMFPGVEGGPALMESAYRGLREGGVTAAIHVHDWNRPFGLLNNLMSYDDNLRVAGDIADQIETYRADHPDHTIDLLGYSGGGGLAIMVAEALDPDVRLRNIVLVQPAISPGYDLSRAIHRVDGHIVHFYSPADWVILGLGTAALGTMDRKYVASSGRNGFDVPQALPDVADRSRLIQKKWEPGMIRAGHIGGHAGILSYAWNKEYVAPYLQPAKDDP